ncbi:PD40 domain-containing protein [Aquimarina brevivitae]|uniref:WD40 repeat protein n=1 Tax=Aquimarina brevivitae TaxID=323412 RepID=A0A4Q7P1G0_9FLAO|nr:PD40 domain-containing protein [Aquimarina brevivitae]RZS93397.1 WD40 repeat protein [Aquimarina brevivitae]
MNKTLCVVTLALFIVGCKNENAKLEFLTEKVPNKIPIVFKKEIIPDDKIIHKGVFSPDLKEYYYTISDKNFENFNVYKIEKTNGIWSEPKEAFFNSAYNDHGMSFSPNGKTLYFSSTRPVGIDGIPKTWHIWKADKINGTWNEPVFVDIPNCRTKLVSHPTVTRSGTLYFHKSNLDYSEMDIYYAEQVHGKFKEAKKVELNAEWNTCTPYISPKEDYLIYATIGNQLDLMISYNNGSGNWTNTKKLNDKINTKGQGNPYVTPDNKFLFFTTGAHLDKKWNVKWVNIESEIKNN